MANRVHELATIELERQEWYHGWLPRADADTLLSSRGDFLVRTTFTQHDEFMCAKYILSLKLDAVEPKHILISRVRVHALAAARVYCRTLTNT
jgi:hypothetical protein